MSACRARTSKRIINNHIYIFVVCVCASSIQRCNAKWHFKSKNINQPVTYTFIWKCFVQCGNEKRTHACTYQWIENHSNIRVTDYYLESSKSRGKKIKYENFGSLSAIRFQSTLHSQSEKTNLEKASEWKIIHFNVAIVVELSSCRSRGSVSNIILLWIYPMWQGIQSVSQSAVPCRQAKRPCEFKQPGMRQLHGPTWATNAYAQSMQSGITFRFVHVLKLTVCAWPFAVAMMKKKKHQIYFYSHRVSCVWSVRSTHSRGQRTNNARSSLPSFRFFPSCFPRHSHVPPPHASPPAISTLLLYSG